MIRSFIVFSTALALSLIPRFAAAQMGCRVADDDLLQRTTAIQRLVTDTTSRSGTARARYDLPAVVGNEVVQVQDSTICQQAAAAYDAALPPSLRSATRQVHVLRIGTTRYLVWDETARDETKSEFTLLVTMDTTFAILTTIAG